MQITHHHFTPTMLIKIDKHHHRNNTTIYKIKADRLHHVKEVPQILIQHNHICQTMAIAA
jgi:hypothetical protein